MGIDAAILGAIAAVSAAGTAYSVVQGKEANQQQKEAIQKQEAAQKQAMQQAQSQQRRSEMMQNQAQRRQPDVGSIMQRAGAGAQGGASSTMLTGPYGVDPGAMSLGRNTLLGG